MTSGDQPQQNQESCSKKKHDAVGGQSKFIRGSMLKSLSRLSQGHECGVKLSCLTQRNKCGMVTGEACCDPKSCPRKQKHLSLLREARVALDVHEVVGCDLKHGKVLSTLAAEGWVVEGSKVGGAAAEAPLCDLSMQ